MLCERVSLLTKSTRAPWAMEMLRGLAPAAVIVICVVWTGGVLPGSGVAGDFEHEAARAARPAASCQERPGRPTVRS